MLEARAQQPNAGAPEPPETVVTNRAPAPAKSFYFEIFATSLAALLLEIAYTRIFSFKVFYYFTYLILGVGLLGIGAGGILVAISERLRKIDPARLIAALAFAGGASILAGYFIIAPIQLNVGRVIAEPLELVKLLFVSLVLAVPFLAVGLVISTILGSRPERANRLYGADLLGAALGCALCIPLIKWLDPPRAVLLSGVILAAGGLRLAVNARPLFAGGLAVVAATLAPVVLPGLITDPVVAKSKTYEDFRDAGVVEFSEWSPVFRVDVSEHPFYPEKLYLLHHDGLPGSGIRRFSGDLSEWNELRQDPRSIPFEVLSEPPRVLIIGAAGGHEILASLFFDAEHITGVELNPVTVSLLTEHFADFSGHLPDHPKVDLVNGDGRWFLAQADKKYDLIWFVAPDSYAAMNASTSGAFVLSESYLYTVEMLRESLQHLTENGVICTQFGEIDYDNRPNRTTRYLATAREAYQVEGIEPFGDHVMVSSAAGFPPFLESVVLLGKKPFSNREIDEFVDQTEQVEGGVVRYVPTRAPDETPVNEVITVADSNLEAWFEEQPYQVDAIFDDSPFFWHFTRFSDAIRSPLPSGGVIVDYEDAIAEQVTLVMLLLVVLLAAILLLLPVRAVRSVWHELPNKAHTALYFSALGLGFMFFEIGLIQNLTLFLGYPTYSLSVTLFSILIFSGLGSLLSGRYLARRNRALALLLAGLVVLAGVYQIGLPPLIEAFVGQALPLRIAITIVLIAPLGLCLGAFMPVGLSSIARLTEHKRQYVAWAWAINGFFSVIASILSTIIAMAAGFRVLMLAAVVIYAIGVAALSRVPAPSPAELP